MNRAIAVIVAGISLISLSSCGKGATTPTGAVTNWLEDADCSMLSDAALSNGTAEAIELRPICERGDGLKVAASDYTVSSVDRTATSATVRVLFKGGGHASFRLTRASERWLIDDGDFSLPRVGRIGDSFRYMCPACLLRDPTRLEIRLDSVKRVSDAEVRSARGYVPGKSRWLRARFYIGNLADVPFELRWEADFVAVSRSDRVAKASPLAPRQRGTGPAKVVVEPHTAKTVDVEFNVPRSDAVESVQFVPGDASTRIVWRLR